MTVRLQQLDALRGIAILLVLGRHVGDLPKHLPSWLLAPLEIWKHVGWMGVDLFFVTSGFLVSTLVFREHSRTGSFSARKFLIRRGFKIYPLYYLLIGAGFIWLRPLLHTYPPGTMLAEALLVQNYYPGQGYFPLGHTWSLAVEEHFYIGLAVLLPFCLRKQSLLNRLPQLCVGLMVFVFTLKCLGAAGLLGQFDGNQFSQFTHLRIDALTFGILLAYANQYRHETAKQFFLANKNKLIAASLLMPLPCALGGYSSPLLFSFGLTLEYLGFGILLMLMIYCLDSSKQKPNLLSAIGVCSYSIYLWHDPIGRLVLQKSLPAELFIVQVAVYCLLCIVIGLVSFKLIETPMISLRNRLFPDNAIGRISGLPEIKKDPVAV